jgi:hypothetical protein
MIIAFAFSIRAKPTFKKKKSTSDVLHYVIVLIWVSFTIKPPTRAFLLRTFAK